MNEQSFIRSLFFGVIDEGLLFPWPVVSEAERTTLPGTIDALRRFFELRVDSTRIDRDRSMPAEVLAGLRQLGLFGLVFPKSQGGGGLSCTGLARVLQEVAGLDASVALTLAAHQTIGSRGLMLFGTPELKDRYLPRLASGELVAAFALTEPGAGSDAAAITTRAEPVDGGFVLNGSKVWITNGGIADLFTVFARTSPADEGVKPKITAFLVERSWGVRSGPSVDKLGVRGSSTTEVSFDAVRVPAANVLGEAGRGFRVAMQVLDGGRVGLAASCVGLCKRVLKMSVDRCKERRAFGRPIGEFGLVKDKIASMLADTWALESATYLTAGLVDGGLEDHSVESAICKVLGSETCARVVDEAMQIAAGAGYMADHAWERMLRDARVHLVLEGTNETLRAYIALAGMQGPGRELADVSRAMREPIKGFGLLSDFAIRKARSAFGRERLTRHHPVLNREAVVFEEYVQELARGVDNVLRKHGRDIAEMQYTQKRTADLAIDLYAIAACIARTTRSVERRGEEGARREIDLTSIFVAAAEERMARTVAAFDKNDDELRKAVASKAYVDGGYPFDVISP
jgi:acyl-CoA dehydrogenase family protein 9